MNRASRNRFSGQRAHTRPARSPTAQAQAANDRLAVELGISSFLAGQSDARKRARYLIAAQLVTKGLASLSDAACSVTSKGPDATILAFKDRGGGE